MSAKSTFFRKLIARDPFMVGRMAKIYRGFEPNDGSAITLAGLAAELFIIDKVTGPDEMGHLTVVLSDVLKLADKSMLPLPTDGKLIGPLPATLFTGAVVSATPTTVVLPDGASAVDNFYNGAEVLVIAGIGTGEGNRQKVASYVGASRTVTLVGTWAVQPVAGSVLEIAPLSLTLNGGKGPQYNDPALVREFVRLGDEVIEYTTKTGDVLSWVNGSKRAQFGTTRADHAKDDKAQQCTVFENMLATDVIVYLLRKATIPDSLIDLAGLAAEDATWLGTGSRITAQLTTPEKIGEHLKTLTHDLDLMLWWDPLAQKVKGKVNAPQFAVASVFLNDGKLVSTATRLDRLDDERVTRVAIDFGLRSATANRSEARNYLFGKVRVDADAEGPNQFGPGGIRINQTQSRWLSAANAVHAEAICARKLNWLRDAPTRLHARLDPDDLVVLGELVDATTRRLVDQFGDPKLTTYRVVKLDEQTKQREVDMLSTNFAGRRWAFIAPNGLPNYSAASDANKRYAYISPAGGANFANGDTPYLII